MRFLSQRDRQPELMDQPGLDAAVHRCALAGLGKANAIGRIARHIWGAVCGSNVHPANGQPLRVLDIASGGGDITIAIAKLAAAHGVRLEIDGCDVSPTAIEFAERAAQRAGVSNVQFRQLDVLVDPLDEYDLVMSTLFLHHLTGDEARNLLERMGRAARRLVLVDDLQRNRLGYAYAWAGVRLLTRSKIVHTDGPLSVRAAFTIDEAVALAREAGWQDVRVKSHWPQRFLMTWKKS